VTSLLRYRALKSDV